VPPGTLVEAGLGVEFDDRERIGYKIRKARRRPARVQPNGPRRAIIPRRAIAGLRAEEDISLSIARPVVTTAYARTNGSESAKFV
jgi:hypothetical protein